MIAEVDVKLRRVVDHLHTLCILGQVHIEELAVLQTDDGLWPWLFGNIEYVVDVVHRRRLGQDLNFQLLKRSQAHRIEGFEKL